MLLSSHVSQAAGTNSAHFARGRLGEASLACSSSETWAFGYGGRGRGGRLQDTAFVGGHNTRPGV